jgi:hypothetical protein
MRLNGMDRDPLIVHIEYLEDEVKKIDERADRAEAMIPNMESTKKYALRKLVSGLRDEASEYRRYVALMKQIAKRK